MLEAVPPFVSFAPGRVCLFGEHQDYLGMPVIAAAIPLGCRLVVEPSTDGVWVVHTPQLNFTWSCSVKEAHQDVPELNPDASAFLRAGLQEALDSGWSVHGGGRVKCHVDLPLQAGLSSSSALVVAWVQALARVAGISLSPLMLAQRAHQVEVIHFGDPGGHMDHVASALGGIHRIHPNWSVEKLSDPNEGAWIVVDSGETKDTRGHLSRCKKQRLALLEAQGGSWMAPGELENRSALTKEELSLWQCTWDSIQLEKRAAENWKSPMELAHWMFDHHVALRDGLGLSTSRLEALGKAAMEVGAWGWKVVGSGGGGCAVIWCSNDVLGHVHQALRNAGAKASWTLPVSTGARCIPWNAPKYPAVVLAGGKSSRMKRVMKSQEDNWSDDELEKLATCPKAMLPVDDTGRPFLSLVLDRIHLEGVDHVCVVRSCEDAAMPALLQPWLPEGLQVDFTYQILPAGAKKPLGTADAVQRGLEAHPEWQGLPVAVFNGDNLLPVGAVELLGTTSLGAVAFARSELGLPEGRERAFAIFEGCPQRGVSKIIEKPSEVDVNRAADNEGEVWVSMNVFRLSYDALLKGCHQATIHPKRLERELPQAVMLASQMEGHTLQWLPFRGAFLDMTHPRDWRYIQEEIKQQKI